MEQQFMSADETDRYVDSRIERALQERRRAPRRSFMQSVGRAVNIIVSLVLFSLLGAVLYYIAAMQYHLPLPLNLTATEQTVYSTSVPAQQPLPTQRVYMSPVPNEQPAAAPVAPTAEPQPTATPAPNVGLSTPDDNPGFTCGVEPGMPPNATCEETNPNNDAQLSSAPKHGPLHVGERGSEKAGPTK